MALNNGAKIRPEDLNGLYESGVKGRIGISGTLTYRDKDGNVLKTVEMNGSVPLDKPTLEERNGSDNR